MIAFGNFTRLLLGGLLMLAFTGVGFYFGAQSRHAAELTTLFESSAFAGSPLMNLARDSAARGKAMSLATGRVEENIDALYGLDHLTGDLFCWILNTRTGEVASTFTFNVNNGLGITDADADYVMATGSMDFNFARTGNERVAQSVVYVGEGNSGKVAGIVLGYERQTGVGELRLISTAMTRSADARRDQ